MSDALFAERLATLADIAVEVGVNLKAGQELVVTAPLEAQGLVRLVAAAAYRRGGKLVTCLYEDPELLLERFNHADDATLDQAAAWLSDGVATALDGGAARLYVVGPYPDLLTGVAPERVLRVHTALGTAESREARYTSETLINWSTVPFATRSWAKTVFPESPPEKAVARLWDAIFAATRVTAPTPLEAWREHERRLRARREMLQEKQFAALRFHDGRTDLTIGLADGHRWVGGSVIAANGVECFCNIPSEEVFTCPHRERADGVLHFSKPLALAGTIVEGVRIELRDGRIESLAADKGRDTLDALLSADEGARRLGEVGLVPHSSPISQSGTLFYNPLFDENAASHVAFGQSYAACTSAADADSRAGCGANVSSIHIDCMVGSAAMNVDGIHRSGHAEPLMRSGEFVI